MNEPRDRNHADPLTTYRCGCGTEEQGAYLRGGLYQAPAGWFHYETDWEGVVWLCPSCAVAESQRHGP